MSEPNTNSAVPLIDRDMTVLIPTVGREILRECLTALVNGERLPGTIIIVDQSSSPLIREMLRPAEHKGISTTHVCSNERGRSVGLNRGLQRVTSRFVAVTDDDCVPDSNWIAALGDHLRDRSERVYTGRVTTKGAEPVLGSVTRDKTSIARKPSLVFDRLSGGNMGLAMEIFGKVGLFDEDPCVRYSEDGEWAYRALRHKVEIAFVPDVVVCHVGWRNESERVEQYRGYGRSQAAFFGKYLRRGDLFMLLRSGIHVTRVVKRWLTGVVRRDTELAVNGRMYTLQFAPGLLAGFRSKIEPPQLMRSTRGAR